MNALPDRRSGSLKLVPGGAPAPAEYGAGHAAQWSRGRLHTIVIASGMKTPPVKPWPARQITIIARLSDMPHSIEKRRNSAQLTIR